MNSASRNNKFIFVLLYIQGIYFTVTGIWPFIHLESFLWVTGPKTDIWLLKTVAALITIVGITYLVGAFRREISYALVTLALGGTFSLMAVDIYYATTDVIWDVYLLDAIAEAGIIFAWIFILVNGKFSL